MTKNRLIYFDEQVLGIQAEHLQHDLDLVQAGTSAARTPSSPRWVNCKQCGAYRGDPCHTEHGYCEERVAANRKRLEELDTWAVSWKSPCHGTAIWLCWRTAVDGLLWTGVPCFAPGCGTTFTIEQHASDLLDQRMPVERLNPHLVEMLCWATEEENPWPE